MTLSHRRLLNQRLTHQPFANPAEVVRWLGAVQSQDYLFAKWSLAQRVENRSATAPATATDAALDRAFNAGDFLRTHVMRPTWFFVPPQDIRWMLMLTAPRVHQVNGTYYRREGVDVETMRRASQVMVRALEGGNAKTREQLYNLLRADGLIGETPGLRGTYIMMHAELDGLICSGPLLGKQQSYMLLAERAPTAHELPRDEALATLARRFFISHGPATRKDFSRWSGLSLGDSDRVLQILAPELASETVEKKTYWFDPASPPLSAAPSESRAFLVSGYDEYLNGYSDWNHATLRSVAAGIGGESYLRRNQMAIVDGQVVGVWGRTLSAKTVRIEIDAFFDLTVTETAALQRVASQLGDFYERTPEIAIAPFAAH